MKLIIHAEMNGKEGEGGTRIEGQGFAVIDLLNLFCNIVNAVHEGVKENTGVDDDRFVNYIVESTFKKAVEARDNGKFGEPVHDEE